MMWLMVLCCAAPLLILLFAGGGLSSGGYFWPVLIGIFIVGHILMMSKGHGGHGDSDTENASGATLEKQPNQKVERKQSGWCH